MYYFDFEQKLEEILDQLLIDSSLPTKKFIDEIYVIAKKNELTLGEIGIVLEQVIKIVKGEKHRDQLFEMLEENFDWPREMMKEIASKLDDRVLSPLQKYIKKQNKETRPQINETPRSYVPPQSSEIIKPQTSPQTQTQAVRPQFQTEEDQKNEIERLKEKIQRLEEGKSQYIPQTSQSQQNKTLEEEPKRFGIEPAEDLGTEDFDWQGDVGGVEIEKEDKEIEDEEKLDKAKILEEVENPPVYSSFSPLEEKLQKTKQINDGPIKDTQEQKPQQEEMVTNFSSTDTNNKEQRRREIYKDGDPYREPLD